MRKYEHKTNVRLKRAPLLTWRAQKRWTQKRAAKHCKVSIPTYQSAEYGKVIQLRNAGLIAAATGIPLEQLEDRSA